MFEIFLKMVVLTSGLRLVVLKQIPHSVASDLKQDSLSMYLFQDAVHLWVDEWLMKTEICQSAFQVESKLDIISIILAWSYIPL